MLKIFVSLLLASIASISEISSVCRTTQFTKHWSVSNKAANRTISLPEKTFWPQGRSWKIAKVILNTYNTNMISSSSSKGSRPCRRNHLIKAKNLAQLKLGFEASIGIAIHIVWNKVRNSKEFWKCVWKGGVFGQNEASMICFSRVAPDNRSVWKFDKEKQDGMIHWSRSCVTSLSVLICTYSLTTLSACKQLPVTK